ncbi:ubiquitin carboxyl-terminal hydrolase, family 1 domain-containing protein [Rhizoctonia solani AG-1 IA]|uniref:Ubiquitin carboxyl-terminal hydrolase n=1 Tax=Thanatephorus cucumeris (strain AG1-IA) TaxID=983506 RepID=L8X320_THACA|nr:ubiquitin carboxyl-terminal hydrolase, family 1 domain-containing protein [Rhizoctonia solani AG-1 IA]
MPASIPDSAAATAASSVTGGDIPTPHTVEEMKPDPKWIPLESNPEVSWSGKLGLTTKLFGFSDVYGLDPELLAMVPSPSKAVVLLFPITDATEQKRKDDDERLAKEAQPDIDPTLIYIKQTVRISNACGTIGLLHAILNSDIVLTPGSPLAQFIDLCKGRTPEERGKLLEETTLFAKAHIDAATSGQSAVPAPDRLDTDLHFTCFVIAPSPETKEKRLIELDGRRAGPIDHGPSEQDKLLEDVAKIVKERYISVSSSINFSMLSLGPHDN